MLRCTFDTVHFMWSWSIFLKTKHRAFCCNTRTYFDTCACRVFREQEDWNTSSENRNSFICQPPQWYIVMMSRALLLVIIIIRVWHTYMLYIPSGRIFVGTRSQSGVSENDVITCTRPFECESLCYTCPTRRDNSSEKGPHSAVKTISLPPPTTHKENRDRYPSSTCW